MWHSTSQQNFQNSPTSCRCLNHWPSSSSSSSNPWSIGQSKLLRNFFWSGCFLISSTMMTDKIFIKFEELLNKISMNCVLLSTTWIENQTNVTMQNFPPLHENKSPKPTDVSSDWCRHVYLYFSCSRLYWCWWRRMKAGWGKQEMTVDRYHSGNPHTLP